ncbi:MAG: hypothetical protein OEV42_09075 [Deltaproteobacteria bacterium]|nr:hypothetical protein [Deltaproteobacteria bacterium]
MTSKRFFYSTILLISALSFSIIGSNLYLNEFGLFASRKNIRIWGQEKTSKYLLSFRYIPENFEGVIMGPSFSDNLDTRKIKGFKIYNMSMDGANISELKYAIENVINYGGVKYVIICLSPYITNDSGTKGRQIDPREYWGSLFSFLPHRIYKEKKKTLKEPEKDRFHASEWGYNDFNILKKGIDFADIVKTRRADPKREIHIDKNAYSDFQELINFLHRKKVKLFAFYFPMYHEFYEEYRKSGAWAYYKKKMDKLFSDKDLVWDMNEKDYHYITKALSSYSDGHLSNLGADKVVAVLEGKLNEIKNGAY